MKRDVAIVGAGFTGLWTAYYLAEAAPDLRIAVLEAQVAGFFTANESFDVGCDTCSPVSDQYESPFAFTGTIVRVVVDISEATFEDLAAQHEAHARFAMATQ